MSLHSPNITNIPIEIILSIFDKIININDIIKFAESNTYIFNIYKNYIDQIINKLLNNNKNNGLVNYVICGCYNNDSIQNKLNNIKLIANFLSNNTNEMLLENYNNLRKYNPFKIDKQSRMFKYYFLRVIHNYNHEFAKLATSLKEEHYNIFMHFIKNGYNMNDSHWIAINLNTEQIKIMIKIIERGIPFNEAKKVATKINEKSLQRIFELIDENFSIESAIIVNNFNEIQLEKINVLINLGLTRDISVNAINTFNQTRLDLFIKIANINNTSNFLQNIIKINVDENKMKSFIKLLEHGFDKDELILLSYSISEMGFFNEAYIEKFILLKQKGIPENLIRELLENYTIDNFDFDLLDYLIEEINDYNTIVKIIIKKNDCDDFNYFVDTVIKLINENIKPEQAFHMVDNSKVEENSE